MRRGVEPRHSALVVLALAACLAVVLAGCDAVLGPGDSPGPTPIHSGVRGIVLINQTCGVLKPGASPCPPPTLEPYVARLVILDGNGAVVSSVTSGADGRFEALLGPGRLHHPARPRRDPLPNALAVSVTVVDDSYADVEVDYDTEVR